MRIFIKPCRLVQKIDALRGGRKAKRLCKKVRALKKRRPQRAAQLKRLAGDEVWMTGKEILRRFAPPSG